MADCLIKEGRLFPLSFQPPRIFKEDSVTLHSFITHLFLQIFSFVTFSEPKSMQVKIEDKIIYVNRSDYLRWRGYQNRFELNHFVTRTNELREELLKIVEY